MTLNYLYIDHPYHPLDLISLFGLVAVVLIHLSVSPITSFLNFWGLILQVFAILCTQRPLGAKRATILLVIILLRSYELGEALKVSFDILKENFDRVWQEAC